MYTCMDMIKYMWHIGIQPVYITFIAFYLYFEYVGWFSMCITILALQMDTRDCLQMSRQQSHLKYEPSANVKIEVIPHYFIHNLWPWFLIVLGDVSYTGMWGCVQGVAKALVIWNVL